MFTFSRILTGPRELSGGAVSTPPLSGPPGSGPPRTAAPRQKAFCSEHSTPKRTCRRCAPQTQPEPLCRLRLIIAATSHPASSRQAAVAGRCRCRWQTIFMGAN